MKDMENIRAVAKLKPDYMGFIFYEASPRFADIYTVKTIIPELHKQGIKSVAVVVNEAIERVKVLAVSDFAAIQLHGKETPSYCKELADFRKALHLSFEIIKVFGVDDDFNFEETKPYLPYCDYFLFDTKSPQHGGTGQQFDWKILSRYQQEKPFFLSGGIGVEEIENGKWGVESENENQNESKNGKWKMENGKWMHGLDMNSKLEVAPGMKDIEKVKRVLENINR